MLFGRGGELEAWKLEGGLGLELPADSSVAVPDDIEGGPDPDTLGLRKIFDWIEKDNGETVVASAIQTVGQKSWE
jgi:hypothetical protein